MKDVTVWIDEEYGFRLWKWVGKLNDFIKFWNACQDKPVWAIPSNLFPGVQLTENYVFKSLNEIQYYVHIHDTDDSHFKMGRDIIHWGNKIEEK